MDPRTLSRKLFIATPCPMKWNQMEGNARVRHCASCQRSVFNVSEMATEELERLLLAGKTACVRLRRRPDGTVVTGDCRQRWRARRTRAQERLSAGVGALTAVGLTVVVLVATLTLLGNDLRRFFGTATTGALSGRADRVEIVPPEPDARFEPSAQATLAEDGGRPG